jgi:hypothetical protein
MIDISANKDGSQQIASVFFTSSDDQPHYSGIEDIIFAR